MSVIVGVRVAVAVGVAAPVAVLVLVDVGVAGAGPGRTVVDGDGASGVFQVLAPGAVDINGLTIRNGTAAGGGIDANTRVRLTRVGSTITAYKSSNGTSWTQVGSLSASFPSTCYIGLAVASGTSGDLNTSQFSNVSVTP